MNSSEEPFIKGGQSPTQLKQGKKGFQPASASAEGLVKRSPIDASAELPIEESLGKSGQDTQPKMQDTLKKSSVPRSSEMVSQRLRHRAIGSYCFVNEKSMAPNRTCLFLVIHN